MFREVSPNAPNGGSCQARYLVGGLTVQLRRPCIDCGILIDTGNRCAQHRRDQRRLWHDASSRRRQDRIRGYGAARRLRNKINKLDSVDCEWCGGNFIPRAVHVDHIRPLALNGLDIEENLRILCIPCHKRREYPKP